VEHLKRAFRSVSTRKPAASRESSAEVYLLARGVRPTNKDPAADGAGP